MVDFPEPERPVNQTVQPLNPPFPWTAARESRVTLDLWTRMFSDFGAVSPRKGLCILSAEPFLTRGSELSLFAVLLVLLSCTFRFRVLLLSELFVTWLAPVLLLVLVFDSVVRSPLPI
jgi:hypothetical protein